jgi:nicotinate-nucleotide adenylyltransferase
MVSVWLLWTRQVDAVWLVPVYRHAFEGRQDKTLAPYDRRLAWCRLMAQDIGAAIEVSDVESRLPVPSFTIDTLRHLQAAHPEHRFRLVIGADVIPQLPDWRDWEGIAADFAPIIVGRVGYEAPEGAVTFPGVSSTEIRRRIVAGEEVSQLITGRVAADIREAGWPGRR